MKKPFHELHERLLRAGVAPRHVRRYLAELSDHLADLIAEEQLAGHNRADAESAALLRLGSSDDLARAMIGQHQFQAWSARAPWATFGLGPLALLVAAYFLACLILWSGWQIFLPLSRTPFVRIDGIAVLFFGVGRSIYFAAPILVGWVIVLIAARQRLKLLWPIAGLVPIAFIASMARVHVTRPSVPGAAGHVSMGLSFPTIQGVFFTLLYVLVILSLTLLPYLLWRLLRALAHAWSTVRPHPAGS